MEIGPISPGDEHVQTVTMSGGWCEPSAAVYDLCKVPDLFTAMNTPITPAPPPTLRQRVGALRRKLRKSRAAARQAWKYPDGFWETEY